MHWHPGIGGTPHVCPASSDTMAFADCIHHDHFIYSAVVQRRFQMNDLSAPSVRLTEFAHGGGCGCKLAPAVLQQLLAGQVQALFPQLRVGNETADDAAVWQISDFA
jgi:hypothetical protein